MHGQKSASKHAEYSFLQQTFLPLILQEQECVPASGELSPEGQEWSPYSPGHTSRHGNPLLYPNRPSVGKLLGQELGAGLVWAQRDVQSLGRGDIVAYIQPVIVIVGLVSEGYVLGSLSWLSHLLWLGKGQWSKPYSKFGG